MQSCYVIVISAIFLPLTVVGEWGKWTEFTPCSVTCGEGIISRKSLWIPEPGEPESDNIPTLTDKYPCSAGDCPVDGKWTRWGSWSDCSMACGGGERKRFRTCSNPSPKFGGEKCKGLDWEKEDCNKVDCPPTPLNFDMSICNESYFKCDSGTMCIPILEQCNENVQCDDGSDEMKCDELLRVRDGGRVGYSFSGNGSGKITEISVVLGLVFLMSLLIVLQ